MSRLPGYEERHYDVMLIAFHALCVSENRKKPAEIASDARACADAFVAELVKIDQEAEEEQRLERSLRDEDLTHENAERDTEPPPEGGLHFADTSTIEPLAKAEPPRIDEVQLAAGAALADPLDGKDLDTGAATP